MIINKVTYTDEEQQKLNSYIAEYQKNINTLIKDFSNNEPTKIQIDNNSNILLPELAEYVGKILLIYRQALDRYTKSFNGDYKLIISDIEDVVNNFERADYLAINKGINIENPALMYSYFIDIQAAADTEKDDEDNENEEKKYVETLLKILHPQLEALKYCSPENAQLDITQIIRSKVEKIYIISDKTAEEIKKATGLLDSSYIPLYNGNLLNSIMKIDKKKFDTDIMKQTATMKTPDGIVITIEGFSNLLNGLGTSAKKIFDVAGIYLSDINYYCGNTINPTVEIPLIEYGEKCGYLREGETPTQDNLKNLKRLIKHDLHDISSITITGEEKKGKNKGDYTSMRIISSHSIRNGIIKINFDIDAAKYLVNSYVAYLPTALFLLDNRNPNAYVIGRKIALHNSIDQNRRAGTECTLAVKTLLEAAPRIPTIEELQARKQRNWKSKIKDVLETSLNDCVKVGFIKKWEYRLPNNSNTYSADKANSLTWEEFNRLMVDFVLIDAPEQAERREKKAALIEAAKEAAATTDSKKRKRGRPKKQAT